MPSPSYPPRPSVILGLFLGLFSLTACHAPHPVAAPLVVASDLSNPPFAEVDDQGQPRGRDVEMMAEIARRLGRPLVWRRESFEVLLDLAAEGEVDVVCATLGITPEREQRMRFSRPYFETQLAVVVRAGPEQPKQLSDLEGRRVAAGQGTTSERALALRLPKAIAVLGGSKDTSVKDRLLSGEIDAYVLDGPNAEDLVESSTGRLRRLAEDLESERYGLALPMDRVELVAQIDGILADMKREGFQLLLDTRYGLVTNTSR